MVSTIVGEQVDWQLVARKAFTRYMLPTIEVPWARRTNMIMPIQPFLAPMVGRVRKPTPIMDEIRARIVDRREPRGWG